MLQLLKIKIGVQIAKIILLKIVQFKEEIIMDVAYAPNIIIIHVVKYFKIMLIKKKNWQQISKFQSVATKSLVKLV